MIFSDQDTANELRELAWNQIAEYIADTVIRTVNSKELIGDPSPEDVFIAVKDRMNYDFPRLAQILIWRSGMVHKGENGHYPVRLYFDEDASSDYPITAAMVNTTGMTGGLVKHSDGTWGIHT